MNQAYQTYRQTQTHTAPPAELVVMLYRGAVRFVSAAAAALESGDRVVAHNNLVRAQAIIAELSGSLNMDRGGEIAQNLLLIYDYLNRRLVESNVQKAADPAREVETLLRELLPAWEHVARVANVDVHAAARTPVAA